MSNREGGPAPARIGADGSASAAEYNYAHFHPKLLAEDLRLVVKPQGLTPGDVAPDFELADSEGRRWRLSELRGRPVVLITGSGTCPMTHGSVFALKEVHAAFADRTQWFYLYVREAHPGEEIPSHASQAQKVSQAERFRRADEVPWAVLVDDLAGSVAHRYTTLPNAQFVVDADGVIAFRGDLAHGPSLYRALDQLLRQGGRGVVAHADDSRPHMLATMAFGWDGIRRGGDVSKHDVWKAAPPMAANLWLGTRMRPLLAPLARRGRPLPGAVKLAAGALLVTLIVNRARARRAG